LFIYLHWVVTVRKDIKKGLVGQEVESRENLFLFFEVSIQSFLTSFDVTVETIKLFFSAFSCASINDARVLDGISHQLLPFNIYFFKSLGVFRQLATDILRG